MWPDVSSLSSSPPVHPFLLAPFSCVPASCILPLRRQPGWPHPHARASCPRRGTPSRSRARTPTPGSDGARRCAVRGRARPARRRPRSSPAWCRARSRPRLGSSQVRGVACLRLPATEHAWRRAVLSLAPSRGVRPCGCATAPVSITDGAHRCRPSRLVELVSAWRLPPCGRAWWP